MTYLLHGAKTLTWVNGDFKYCSNSSANNENNGKAGGERKGFSERRAKEVKAKGVHV